MSKKTDISNREAKLLRFIAHCQALGYTPSLREMQDDAGVAKATSTIHYYLEQLERFGYILRDGQRARRIRVLRYV